MARRTDKNGFPGKDAILRFINESPAPPSRKEIARAFNLRGDDKDRLKEMLRELKDEGTYSRRRGDSVRTPSRNSLPPVSIIEVIAINEDGEAVAKPVDWNPRHQYPYIVITGQHANMSAAVGQRLLAKLTQVERHTYTASVLRVLPEAKESRVVGLFIQGRDGGRIEPTNRKDKNTYVVNKEDRADAKQGDVVIARVLDGQSGRMGPRNAEIIENLGKITAPRAASIIAIASQDIPMNFSPAAVKLADAAELPVPNGRVDLRQIPLVTIDGEDARDFDDAVFAEPDKSKKNPGGWHLIVAIADVAHYVLPDDALDKEAFLRGNSCYFPDRVVPMLPENLSNGLCSLKPDEDRYCLAVHLYIDKEGNTIRAEFIRGIMRSHHRLTYQQAQLIADHPDKKENQYIYKHIIQALFGAYQSLKKNRETRGTLDLDLPEYKVKLNEAHEVESISPRPRYDSHRLIEEFMIAANVAAAKALQRGKLAAIFRVHEPPSKEKVDEVREWLGTLGYSLMKGDGLKPAHFNKILKKAEGTPEAQIIGTAILRSQMQAYYSHRNLGHFGLALTHYCHFTSPIRRYSDLIVHRALISMLAMNDKAKDGLTAEQASKLDAVAEHISVTERRAMLAEREAVDRYVVSYMSNKVGGEFAGYIANLNSFGLYVSLFDTGAQGFIPIGGLGSDFYIHEKGKNRLVGKHSGNRFDIGQKVLVKLREANAVTGSLLFELLGAEGMTQERGTPHDGRHRQRKKSYDSRHGKGKFGKRRR